MTEPKIRFKADDGSDFPDWKEVRFGDVFTEISQKTSDTDTYPLYSLTIEDGVTAKSERYERSYLLTKDEDNYKIVPPNAFVYNPMNLRFGALAPNHQDMKVCVSQYYNVFEVKDESTLVFWENYLVSSLMLKHYFSIATGSLIEKLRVHYTNFVEIRKRLPSLPEQQKIADFLSNVDEVIAASEEEVANLEQQKKAVMQKIFSREVRFKKEDGSDFPDWEKKQLSDIFYKVNERNNGQFDKTKWISVAKMYYQEPDKVTSNNIDTRTYVMRKGDMAFEGHPNSEYKYGRFVVNDIGDGVISELFPIYRHKDEYVLNYWKYAIQIESIMSHIYRKAITSSGASSNKLDDNDFLREYLMIPSLPEQQLIADFLTSYDEAITAAKQELAKWKELKKGLLQQMFV